MSSKEKIKFSRQFLTQLRPWVIGIVVIVLLRVTGVLSAVSSVTQYALLQTGAMDAKPEKGIVAKKFDYNFSLVDLNKNKLDVESLKGKVIFINLWATWCGPCRVEMPSIQNLYNSVDRDKVAFIMLSIDQKNPYEKVSSYIQDKDFSFPVYFPSGSLPSQLQVKAIPATFVVDKEGKVVFREMGVANYDSEEFRKFLTGLYQ